MEKVTVYRAYSGAEFNTAEECVTYEKRKALEGSFLGHHYPSGDIPDTEYEHITQEEVSDWVLNRFEEITNIMQGHPEITSRFLSFIHQLEG